MPSGAAVGRESRGDGKRRDVQGLRAVAVTLVVLDHYAHWPAGGFVGVDVFFVISGFLITGLLLREFDRTGSISFTRFYVRRAKRILPAALATIMATVVAAQALLLSGRAREIRVDALWATFFGANWHLAASQTNYFAQGTGTSPLQHFWSLSVEEQFYFVWPWLLLAVLVLARRRRAGVPLAPQRSRIIAGMLIGVLSVGSLAWAFVQSTAAPTIAYFSSFTRAWELGVGAVVAVAIGSLPGLPSRARIGLAWVGLTGIVLAAIVVRPTSAFPAPWALLPVLATALVIAAQVPARKSASIWPIANPVSTYLGDISYSLYLWHFPVLVIGTSLFPEMVSSGRVVLLALAFGIAVLMYHLVELPIHSYRSDGARVGVWRRLRNWMRLSYSRRKLVVTAVAVVTAVPLLAAFVTPASYLRAVMLEPAQSVPVLAQTASATATSGPTVPSLSSDAITAELTAALAATAWPQLTPALDTLSWTDKAAPWVKDGCLGLDVGAGKDPKTTAQRCVYGDHAGTKTVLLWGDSFAISWLPAIDEAAKAAGWKVLDYTMEECPFASIGIVHAGGGAYPECAPYRTWAVSEIARIHPDVVIASEADGLDRLADGVTGGNAITEVAKGVATSLQQIAGSAGKVVALGPPPGGKIRDDCVGTGQTPVTCVSTVDNDHLTLAASIATAVQALAVTNVQFDSTDPLFCVSGYCPFFSAGSPIRADGGHLTDAYSRHLSAVVGTALTAP